MLEIQDIEIADISFQIFTKLTRTYPDAPEVISEKKKTIYAKLYSKNYQSSIFHQITEKVKFEDVF